MAATIRLWIVLTAIGITCAGAAAVYGTRAARQMVPELFVARAVLPVIQSLTPEDDVFDALIFAGDLLGGSWQQSLDFGVNRLEGDLIDIDPSIMATLPLLNLHSNMIWDNARQAYSADLGIRMAVTNVFELDMYLDRNLMMFETPVLFDFPIMVNPQIISEEWNASLLGRTILPITFDDFIFYQAYLDTLFSEPITMPDFTDFLASFHGIENDLEFEHLGQDEFDNFTVSIPASRVNTSIKLLWEALELFDLGAVPTFDEDLLILLQIDGSRLVQVDIPLDGSEVLQLYFSEGGGHIQFSTSQIEGDWHFNNSGRFKHSITTDEFNVFIDWDLSGHVVAENFSFSIDADDIKLSASGLLNISAEKIDTHIRNFDVVTDELNASFNLRTTLERPVTAVFLDSSNARRLADLNIFDLLAMYQNISDSPLGGVLGDFLSLP